MVTLARLVFDFQLVHHRHEDDSLGIRLQNAFLTEVVPSRRDVLFALHGGETRIDVEVAIEEFRVDAFSCVSSAFLKIFPSTCLQNFLKLSTSSFFPDTKTQSRRKRKLLLDGSLPRLSFSTYHSSSSCFE